MESNDKAELARLWAVWVECRASAAVERERLIEMVGDHISTGCRVPTEKEVAALDKLECDHRAAWQTYSACLLRVYTVASWASRLDQEAPSALRRCRGKLPSGW